MPTCRACPKEIIFLYHQEKGSTRSHKANPIEVDPHPEGNLILNREQGIYRIATPEEIQFAKEKGKNLYISHFAVCPNRARFKNRKEQTK